MKNISLKICLVIVALFGVMNVAGASNLPECSGNRTAQWDNCFGAYTNTDEYKYAGEWADGKMDGQGTITFGPGSELSGGKYVGQFKNSKAHGTGTAVFANGDIYVGEWKYNDYHGQGTLTYGPTPRSISCGA